MTDFYETLAARIEERFDAQVERIPSRRGELSYEVRKERLVEVAGALRDEFDFEQLMDLCGIDYLTYGIDEWTTESATERGFSRAVERASVVMDESDQFDPRRFAVVYHLLSLKHNARLRLRVYTGSENPPVVASVVNVWNSANWFEREAFDLYGILFEGHPDLRRILTDYGFIGYPFRKDFPLIGAVEVLYDVEKGRVAYQPVTIEPRTLVPKVIRDDNRYRPELKERPHG